MGVSTYEFIMSIFVGLFTLLVSGSLVYGSVVFWQDRNRIPAVFFFLVAIMLMFACADVLIRFYVK